jgi:hypothetical protein
MSNTEMVLSNFQSDHLVELDLADTIFSDRVLLGLLVRHRGTIRKLSFRACALMPGSWCLLLHWISRKLPRLERLDLQYLDELRWYHDRHHYPLVRYEDLVTLTGKKNIDAYVASL